MSYQPQRQRPQLPPVPPQLKHANTSAGGRPPLPPVPQPYLAEAAEQQKWDRTLAQPRPQRPETMIPADNLQTQAELFHRPNTVAPAAFTGGFLASHMPAGPRRSYSEGVDTNPPSYTPSFPVPQPTPQLPVDRYGQAPPMQPFYESPPLPPRDAWSSPALNPSIALAQSPPVMGISDLRIASPQPPAVPPRIQQGPTTETSAPSAPGPRMSVYDPARHDSRDQSKPGADSGPKTLAKPVIDLATLTRLRDSQADPAARVKWAKQVVKFIERHQAESALTGNATRISDPQMVKYTDEALKIILSCASAPDPVPEALYLRGDLSATGSFPTYRPKDTKVAFRDFEAAANAGFKAAWFRIGREYEAYSEWKRAQTAHERGMSLGDCSSTYRLGMAYLLGQLELTADIVKAVAFLRSAADLADSDTPQPAYIFGMLLAGEFANLPPIPKDVLRPDTREAKNRIEHAAYLGFPAAQYKMGWLHEYAQLGCAFDPLLSVEYYSLASKQGETEADMALSKWFLCGAEGFFAANEGLAVTFAEKAARRGLPSAMFAIAYYFEVGIGGHKDLTAARKWYARAVAGGNKDAQERLTALDQGGPGLSRDEHENNVDVALVRKRTMAAIKSQKEHGTSVPLPLPGANQAKVPPMPGVAPGMGPSQLRRGETMRRVEEARMVAQNALTQSKNERRRQSAAAVVGAGGAGAGAGGGYGGPSPNVTSRPVSSSGVTPNGHLTPRLPSNDPNDPYREGGRGRQGTTPSSTTTGTPNPSSSSSSSSSPSSRRQDTPSIGPPTTRPISYQLVDTGPVTSTPGNHNSATKPSGGATTINNKPTTTFNSFADMGIATATAQNSSECVIM